MNPCAWKWWKNDRRGFTLLETVIALGIFVLLQLILTQVVSAGGRYYHQLATGRLDDWGGFVLQLQRESRMGTLKTSDARTFTFEQPNGEPITYEFYRNKQSGMVRRRVNDEGHQPILMGVEQFTIQQPMPNALALTCLFDNDLKQTFTIQFKAKTE